MVNGEPLGQFYSVMIQEQQETRYLPTGLCHLRIDKVRTVELTSLMKILKKGGLTGCLEELHTEQVATRKNPHCISLFGKGRWNTNAWMSLIKREWASSLSLGLMTESWQPYARDLASNRLWHFESDAFDKSTAITPTSFFQVQGLAPVLR